MTTSYILKYRLRDLHKNTLIGLSFDDKIYYVWHLLHCIVSVCTKTSVKSQIWSPEADSLKVKLWHCRARLLEKT